MTILEIQEKLINEFNFFNGWEERYEYLIELGKQLPSLPNEKKIDDNLIKGCQSRVWLLAEEKDGKLYMQADSDAILPKGIVGMLMQVYSEQPIQDILNSNEEFIKKIGLQEFLSPSRANGLLAMVNKIKFYALAYTLKK